MELRFAKWEVRAMVTTSMKDWRANRMDCRTASKGKTRVLHKRIPAQWQKRLAENKSKEGQGLVSSVV